jgi:hypothetical protein
MPADEHFRVTSFLLALHLRTLGYEVRGAEITDGGDPVYFFDPAARVAMPGFRKVRGALEAAAALAEQRLRQQAARS